MFKLLLQHFKWILPLIILAFSQLAAAQATRTWVSGVGDDANPCSRTAPCKTFAGAISKTAAAGEISVLDSGGFGTLTITKSITIDARGVMAGVLSSFTNGIVVSAAASDVVVLRGLTINGASTGLNGIRFLSGSELHVEDCVIENFLQLGIDAQPSAAGSLLFVKDSIVRDNSDATNGGGISVKPGAGASATVTLDHVRMERNKFGIRVEDNTKATIRDSVATAASPGNGFVARSTSATAEMFIENSIASSNTIAGINAQGSAARVTLSNFTAYNNAQGLVNSSGGQIISFGNNKIYGNVTNGAPTSAVALQ